MYIPVLIFLINSFLSVEPCDSINKGIKSEDISTYSIIERDTILVRKTKLYFNESGLTTTATTITESDTFVTVFSYDNNHITKWKKEYQIGSTDTTTFIAVKWDDNGRATKLVNATDKKEYSKHQYKNCRTIRIKRFQNNELFYSVDFYWDDKRITKTTSHYHGFLKESLGKASESIKSDYLFFDEKDNWAIRSYSKGKKQFIEDRYLEYY